ncbi:MAG TPA: A/G-specific adenine glycosylase [Acidimicrobiia bacterium]|nr:A/G-specific adenine glycosylase [Acidimicrobiia bacterium]
MEDRRVSRGAGTLSTWYRTHGRHDLPWRESADRWPVLVSEVMLQQTQVSRVLAAWPTFIGRFPTPEAMAKADLADVVRAWGTLGYPRRARWLWESARIVSISGWPDDLTSLPGVGRYTAGAIAAQADGTDTPAVDANIRRVVERAAGRRLTEREAETVSIEIGAPLRGRDRLLALMDVGAVVCTPRRPSCSVCPLVEGCATRGEREGERRNRQAPFEGSFRQRRGRVMAALRAGEQPVAGLDAEALASLVTDGLAAVEGPTARLA